MRLPHVQRYLSENKPDILMLQELKGMDYPYLELETDGYKSHAVTQKAYNGVAIISKMPFTVLHEALPGFEQDDQARYLEIELEDGSHVINIYLPNGNPAPGAKYDFKLKWMRCLRDHLASLKNQDIPFVIGGDFNVMPEDKDCHAPKDWADDALIRPETRNIFRSIINLGLTDALRVVNTASETYTFWDYQAGAWQRNNGIRIDHFLLSPAFADRLEACEIHKDPRGWDKPSDHTPIMAQFA